ncbi:Lrp/AsnC family transcriptional regulator [Sphaerisporangium album]|uniref:Lrp/AsnC family transcriptional regulator n=1 Tax=Sphaerisporangium album TaxID=509200 RepID=A0A367FJP3_9ACTN|nr:Lrp/AsnC family transcriptional regulator [Sphaerisporangium album]RCG30613.1 Lrp/AsnC family transcriptional regulator [Sphaerisporangium album]
MTEMSGTPSPGTGVPGRIGIGLQLDAIHMKILEVLRENGRISVAALAERVGISRASAYTRFEALRADGVIKRFTAEVDHLRAGLGITALVFVTVRQQMWKQFRAQLAQMPEVEYCAITTGQHDAMIQVRMADVAAVHALVTERLASIPAVKATETVFILDEVLHRPYVLPSDRRPRQAPSRTAPADPPPPSGVPLGKMRFTSAAEGRADMHRNT